MLFITDDEELATLTKLTTSTTSIAETSPAKCSWLSVADFDVSEIKI
jgi:hypothetical protein